MSFLLMPIMGKELTGLILDIPISKTFTITLDSEKGIRHTEDLKLALYIQRSGFKQKHFVTETADPETSGVFKISCTWVPQLLDDYRFTYWIQVIKDSRVIAVTCFQLPAYSHPGKHKEHQVKIRI